jgi:DNA-directed RNA polymerase specialized sigma24 family protein
MTTTYREASAVNVGDLSSDALWASLYTFLFPLVSNWVYTARIRSWLGQEGDIAWDIVQVALWRTFEYARKLQHEGAAIYSLHSLSVTIAKNYYRDLRRRDARLVHFAQDASASGEQISLDHLIDPEETASEKIYQEWVFGWVARHIAKFPPKLRTALLIDIANRTHFEAEPGALQRALLAVGIRLQDYQQALPVDPVARSRHASLLSLAYRRVKQGFARHNQ